MSTVSIQPLIPSAKRSTSTKKRTITTRELKDRFLSVARWIFWHSDCLNSPIQINLYFSAISFGNLKRTWMGPKRPIFVSTSYPRSNGMKYFPISMRSDRFRDLPGCSGVMFGPSQRDPKQHSTKWWPSVVWVWIWLFPKYSSSDNIQLGIVKHKKVKSTLPLQTTVE